MTVVRVVGGGLAGCEAAWQLAGRGHSVELFEMRPAKTTEAHRTDRLAELVCTNSFKSEDPSNAHGLLKREMRTLGSVILSAADEARVPAGAALAVDRDLFGQAVTSRLDGHPAITLVRDEVRVLPDGPTVIATGPLTSDGLSRDLARELGDEGLSFYDSIAPIVEADSVDMEHAWMASRWDRGDGGDYLNCPMDQAAYEAFVAELVAADVYPGHDWENVPYFEGCLPIEVMAERGLDTLRFGPMKPVGLTDPRTGRRPWAVLQLRREDRHGRMWNLVGCQTRMRTGEQRRIFRMIPALRNAEFLRTGSIHRNTYLNFPATLTPWGSPPSRPDVIVAGQLTGVEGYMESAASGILAGVNLDRIIRGLDPALPPPTTMIGGLYRYLSEAEPGAFQPMNSNFGLVDQPPERIRDRRRRRERTAEIAASALQEWMRETETEAVEPALAGT